MSVRSSLFSASEVRRSAIASFAMVAILLFMGFVVGALAQRSDVPRWLGQVAIALGVVVAVGANIWVERALAARSMGRLPPSIYTTPALNLPAPAAVALVLVTASVVASTGARTATLSARREVEDVAAAQVIMVTHVIPQD